MPAAAACRPTSASPASDTTGLMFYGARYYSPMLGRFVSADTIVPGAANPQSLNRYSYVRNNPVKRIDPSGHADCDTQPGGCGNEDTTKKKQQRPPQPPPPPPQPPQPPQPPPPTVIYWNGWSEVDLYRGAGPQNIRPGIQIGNGCAPCAIANGANLLARAKGYPTRVTCQQATELADAGWLLLDTRLLPGQATLPHNQANLVNWIGSGQLPLTGEAATGTTQDLINLLGESDKLVVVSMAWEKNRELKSAHAMLLVAYDETMPKPWGFVNSHGQGGLNWMSDADFQTRWDQHVFGMGNNQMMIMTIR